MSSEFTKWAQEKFRELIKSINPCNENDEIDPVRLNDVVAKFSGHFAWLVTMAEIEVNKMNIAQANYDKWKRETYNKCERKLKLELGDGGKYTIKAVECRMTFDYGDEEERLILQLNEQISRANLLKMFVKVLDKQANMLQTLSSNMRSEMFYAGGVPIGRNLSDNEKTMKAKTIMRNALKSNSHLDNDEE